MKKEGWKEVRDGREVRCRAVIGTEVAISERRVGKGMGKQFVSVCDFAFVCMYCMGFCICLIVCMYSMDLYVCLCVSIYTRTHTH